MRLNAYISNSGYCSRRKAVDLIKEGRVSINGIVSLEPWVEITGTEAVLVDKQPVYAKKDYYVVLNKPSGVTSTLEDRFAEKKITDMIPKKFGRLYPVGRLDKDSRGLIILTNDGDFCYKLTHPKFEIEKEYEVTVSDKIEKDAINKLKKGVSSDGEILKVRTAGIKSAGENKSVLLVTICEGRKRHIRRLFEGIGMHILDLKRVRIGSLTLGDLRDGEFKIFDKETIYNFTCIKP